MPTYQRETVVRASLEDVWVFYSRIEGLEAVTPDWLGLRVEAAVGPDGRADPEFLEAGTDVDLSIRPFDVGPRLRWTSVIFERERDGGTATLRDEMVDGPFDRWIHTHAFRAVDDDRTVSVVGDDRSSPSARDTRGPAADGATPTLSADEGATLVRDRVEYELPMGGLGDALEPLSWLGFEPMFRYRHRRTRQLLEAGR